MAKEDLKSKAQEKKDQAQEKLEKAKGQLDNALTDLEKKIDAPQSEEDIAKRLGEVRKFAVDKLGVSDNHKSVEEVYDQYKSTIDGQKKSIMKQFSLGTRYYAVFGLTGATFLLTRRLKWTGLAFAGSTFMICPELFTGMLKTK